MTRKMVAAPAAALIAGGMICAAALATSGPAAAHHSFAMYDNDHQLKVSGTVASFQWTNPHVYIELETEAGAPVKHYTIECASPGILTRVGWKFNMIKAGDKLTMVISPLKNGDAGALLKEVKLPDGRKFGNGAPAGKASISSSERNPVGANVGLERGKVVSAALRLLDEVGLDGLTTRRLAEDLGVRGPALYWHFANKQALTDAMAYAVLADAIDDAPVVGDWVALMTGEARRIRRALLSHRDGARLLAGYRPKEPLGRFVNDPEGEPAGADPTEAQANAHLAQLLRALVDAGFDRTEAMSAFMTVLLFTFGWTMDEQAGRARKGPPPSPFNREQGFEFGLATVLAGLQARATAPHA